MEDLKVSVASEVIDCAFRCEYNIYSKEKNI